MRLIFSIKPIFVLLALAFCQSAIAQKVTVNLGPDEIGENQAWTITVTISDERLKSYDNFPEIDGFRKRGQSTQSTTNFINGQISSSQSVIMTYVPVKQGTYNVPSFTMKVNDKAVNVPGKKVKVGAPVQQQQRDQFRNFFDRDDDFFGRGETEFVDVKDDAFLALTTNKNEVYVGEGFNTTLSFYISENNRAPLQFSNDLSQQLSDILKKLKPNNCWEENFNIENIEGNPVTVNGKDYMQYKVYQATFYPLNDQPINFPSVGLEMIKYKVAKNPSFFGQNRKEDYKTFFTKPKKVTVKQLPPHPLRDAIAVGDYHLEEGIRSTDLETGQSSAYDFRIYGEGNISSIEKPATRNNTNFEFYDPNVRQDIGRENGRVTGTKTFSYFLIPKEPGKFNLGDYFQWVYFNPKEKKYDTLRSKLTVFVTGESKKNEVIESNDLGSFYDKMNTTDNNLKTVSNTNWQKWAFTLFLLAVLGASTYLVVRKT
jgi:hypothetical protein